MERTKRATDCDRIQAIADPSDAGAARRLSVAMAGRLGFDASDTGRVALIVTEASTNIIKHAGKGQILLREIPASAGSPGIEILALDRGPGMANVQACFEDGFSTAGSPGTGLGAISRLASVVDVYSAPSIGTALLARVVLQTRTTPAPNPGTLAVGVVRVPAPNETVCGDDWSVIPSSKGTRVLVVDGLGHGPKAAEAAAEAVRVFESKGHHLPLDELLAEIDRALRYTRGAAGSCAEIDLSSNLLEFVGVGNVAGILASPSGSRNIVAHNGTLGVKIGRLQSVSVPLPTAGCTILHTDGLNTHVNTQGYPGLLARDPTLIAGVLYRDFVRGRDDATVVVCRTDRIGT